MRERIAIGLAIIIVILLVLNILCLTGVFAGSKSTKTTNMLLSQAKKGQAKKGQAKKGQAKKGISPTSCPPPISKSVIHSQGNCLNPGVFNGNRDMDPAMFPCNIKVDPWTI